jgi:hypothetical protein
MSAFAPLLGAKRTVSPQGPGTARGAQASRPPKDRAAARSQARAEQFSDRPKYFIAVVTNPASLTLQFYDSEAALQSGTSHPTGGC